MEQPDAADVWASGATYEAFMGRWSRLVANQFVPWLGRQPGQRWLDVGCGSGVLTRAIVQLAAAREVVGVDPSNGFLQHARAMTPKAHFESADAQALPFQSARFDVVVAGLALNFVPDPVLAVSEMARVVRPNGTVAVYVWDYAERMQMLRYFWDAAMALDPVVPDERERFPICYPEPLRQLFLSGGLREIDLREIEVLTIFQNFDDYWTPFLGGQGPAAAYAVRLDETRRAALRERIRQALPAEPDGSIHLVARAWAIRGTR